MKDLWVNCQREAANLERADIDLARVYLQQGYGLIGTAKEFVDSGYPLPRAVAIAHCASQENRKGSK
jgi:hypothetical protein